MLRKLTIKNLILLGFSLVAIPLVIALLFGASQVNRLSDQSEGAIIDIATMLDSEQLLKSAQVKVERSATQYLVLRDESLKRSYIEQSLHLNHILASLIQANDDTQLNNIVKRYQIIFSNIINTLIPKAKSEAQNSEDLIKPIQAQFKRLSDLHITISQRSNELITTQINQIKTEAESASKLMFKSLLIIPMSLLVAIFFILLITKPLRALTTKIKQFQQGNFEGEISLSGSPEIQEMVDALENMRTRLQALEMQKSSFIRHISHELKTPLAAIREGTELLYDNSVGSLNADQQEVTEIIKTSVFKLQQHIEDLLDFNIVLDSTSLQDSEKLIVEEEVNRIIELQKLNIKRKELTLDTQIDRIFFYSNKKQVHVILDNILSNAIKYSPDNGTIFLTCSLIATHLIIEICDQGIGIADENKEKIFDAFYQGPPPENSTLKGSGLGLTIVSELLQRLNGSIEVISAGNNKQGTTIKISFPRAYQITELI